MLSDQEKMDGLFQLGPLGDRKPSQQLASMLSVCPSGMELQPVFQYLFLQRLTQTLRTLLGEQECGDIRALAALADRFLASHKPQPHEVMAVQEPVGSGSGSEPQVAAVQPKKKQFKKKTAAEAATVVPAATAVYSPMPNRPELVLAYASTTSSGGQRPRTTSSPATGQETRDPGAA